LVVPINFLPAFVQYGDNSTEVGKTIFSAKIELENESEVTNLSVSHEDMKMTENGDHTQHVVEIAETDDFKRRDIVVSFSTEDIRKTQVKLFECDKYPDEVVAHIYAIPRLSDEIEEEETKLGDEDIYEPDKKNDDSEPTPGEYIFVIDRSYSMNGTRIKTAVDTLFLFIKSLPEGSKFNVVSFGNKFTRMYKESAKYDDESMEKALNEVKKYKADLGGTNIYKPLLELFKTEPDSQYPRNIFLLTDGQVMDPQTVIKLIEKNNSKARVYSFGIGSDVSEYLVKESAKAGKGSYAFIGDNDDSLNEKVIKALREATKPSLTNIQIDWGSFESALKFPKTICSLHDDTYEEEPIHF
jgi:von Willebrand factor A domain-containing protein 5